MDTPPSKGYQAIRQPDDHVDVAITFLEMTEPPVCPPQTPREDVRVVHARRPTAPYYRFLYETVGDPWLWYERTVLDDDALLALIHHPRIEIHVLQVAGVPAGFCELDRSRREVVDLAYFGLMPEFIGQGLGGWFLRWSVSAAWSSGPRRVTVNTCTLDHPRALELYRSVGFEPLDTTHIRIEDPRPRIVAARAQRLG
jgi:GNAT superfamily N-acetyltransferase